LKWTTIPQVVAGKQSSATVGGIDLGVSKYSAHPNEAFAAALCIRSPENQLHQAINSGLPPVNASLYDDPSMTTAYPMKDAILAELKTATPRPSTAEYQNVSTLISTIISPPSSINSDTANKLRSQIQDALDSKGVMP
jgi:multiple sugar transport system substrate-binding protein